MAKAARKAAEPTTFLDPSTFPDVYGMGTIGKCMEPNYPDGCSIKISKLEPYARGDVVAVWLRPEIIKPGGVPALVKRIAMMPPPWVKAFPYKDHPQSEALALVMMAMDAHPDQLLPMRCSDIIAIHKVLGILKPGESHKVSDEEFKTKLSPRRARR